MPRLSAHLLPTTTVAAVVAAGAFVVGSKYRIVTAGSTDFVTEQGAADNNVGTVFTAIVEGTGTGTASLEVEGDKVKGDGYYRLSDGVHTVAHYILALDGNLIVQGALAAEPVEADWVTLDTRTGTSGSPLTENATYNFTGNFVWVRAILTSFEGGTITKIQLNH
jgi:hypothetical protein